jgi:hypothetical protein
MLNLYLFAMFLLGSYCTKEEKKGRADGIWQAKLEVKRRDEKERLT